MHKLFSDISRFFFPVFCVLCKKPGKILCDNCNFIITEHMPLSAFISLDEGQGELIIRDGAIRKMDPEKICFVQGVAWHEKMARDLLLSYKLGQKKQLGEVIGSIMKKLNPVDRFDVIIPVPPDPERFKERTFDSAVFLAQTLARYSGKPFVQALRKTRSTPDQTGLTARQRRENMAGIFEIGRKDIRNLRILLIDDVMTTGATLSECARVLKEGGSKDVGGAVFSFSTFGMKREEKRDGGKFS